VGTIQHLYIAGKIPGLNELLRARGRDRPVGPNKRHDEYTDLKRDIEHRVVLCARSQRLLAVERAYLTYLFFEENRRRDPSNIVAAGMKLIEDGLRKAQILSNDGWSDIAGFAQYWVLGDYGVAVFLSKHNVLDRERAIYLDQQARNLNGIPKPRNPHHEPL
jgi:hypothetical protein